MMALLLPWWRDRSAREQWLVGGMAVLMLVVFTWLAILRPVEAARARAEARLAAAVAGLGDVRALTPLIRAAQARSGPLQSIPLVELISRRASEAGLTVEAMQTSGDGRVTLRIAAVRPVALLRWIAEIETRDGVVVERVALTRNADATIAADLVFRRGGG